MVAGASLGSRSSARERWQGARRLDLGGEVPGLGFRREGGTRGRRKRLVAGLMLDGDSLVVVRLPLDDTKEKTKSLQRVEGKGVDKVMGDGGMRLMTVVGVATGRRERGKGNITVKRKGERRAATWVLCFLFFFPFFLCVKLRFERVDKWVVSRVSYPNPILKWASHTNSNKEIFPLKNI